MPRKEDVRSIEAECVRLSVAFAVYVDRRRYAEAAALFTDEAVYRPRTEVYIGPRGVMEYLRSRPASRRSRHLISNNLIEVISPEEARACCSFTYFVDDAPDLSRPSPLVAPAAVGDYDDRYVLTPGGWRFAQRLCMIVFEGPGATGTAPIHSGSLGK